jgi:prepilin peptidase CpaA
MTVLIGFSIFILNLARNYQKVLLAIKYKDIGRVKNVFGKKFTFAPVILIAWVWFAWKIKTNLF